MNQLTAKRISNSASFAWQAAQLGQWLLSGIMLVFLLLAQKVARHIDPAIVIGLNVFFVLVLIGSASWLSGSSCDLAVSWDEGGLTLAQNGKTKIFPWAAVGRIDAYSSRYMGRRNSNVVKVTNSLLIEVYEEGQLKSYCLWSDGLEQGNRTLGQVIAEMNAFHEKSLARRAA